MKLHNKIITSVISFTLNRVQQFYHPEN